MEKRLRLYQIEDELDELGLDDMDFDVLEIDDDFQILASSWYVYIPEFGFVVKSGIACVWSEEDGIFMPDFDVTIIYESIDEIKKPSQWMYYEQDGMCATLANMLHGKISLEQIEQIWCELVTP